MFEAKLAQAALFKKIIDAIKDLISDAPFDVSETALCLQSMDGSHVALVSLRLGVSLFDVYRCDRALNLGLSLGSLATALKCSSSNDSCQIKYDEEEGDGVTLLFEDTKRNKSQEYTVKLMDIDAEHLGVPDQKYSAIIEMSSAEFGKTVRDLANFSDTVVVDCQKSGVQFKASGEAGAGKVSFSSEKKDDDEEGEGEADENVTVNVQEPVKLSFSIKYLSQFAKASNLSPRVRLSLTAGVPIVVEYQIEDDGYLKYYLAPKIEEDVDMD